VRYTLDTIATFIAVIETGGLTAAARRLGVSKSVVSTRVAELEAALSATLVWRSTRGVTPTKAGEAFYARVKDVLDALDEAADAVRGNEATLQGHLRISAPVTFGQTHLGPPLHAFLRQHPLLEASISLSDRRVDLAGEAFDLAIRIGRLQDSSLIARRLTTSRRVLVGAPSYLSEAGWPLDLDALRRHATIGYSNAQASAEWQFSGESAGAPPRSVIVRPRLHLDNGEAMLSAAIAGLGLTILPTFVAAPALMRGALVRVLDACEPTPDGVFAVYQSHRILPRRVRALVDHLAGAFSDPPAWDIELGLAERERASSGRRTPTRR